jgi:hypothetical protein
MSKLLRFGDHRLFHRQVIRLSLAGAGLGLLGYLTQALGILDLFEVTWLNILTATTIAGLMGLAANPPGRPQLLKVGAAALGLGFLGALTMTGLSASRPIYPVVGLWFLGLTVGIIAGRDLRDYRRYLLPVATGLSMTLAAWVTGIFVARVPLTEYVPQFLAMPAYGAVFGFLLSTGLVVRQLLVDRDPVHRSFAEMRPQFSGEMLELCERAMATYDRIRDALQDREDHGVSADPRLSKGVQKLVKKILNLGQRWQDVEREANRTSAESLSDRLEELQTKIDASKDRLARRQYEMARDALAAQLGYLRDISRSRERVIARVHHNLATLERLHLAVLNHRGVDAAKFTDELEPILSEIEDFGTEMDFASEAINEVVETADDVRAESEEESRPAPEPDANVDSNVDSNVESDETTAEADLTQRAFE